MALQMKASTAARAARPSRSAVVVRASAESRRAVLGGLFAGAMVSAAGAAKALSPVDLFDDRKAKETGFDLIYEARDLDLPQSVRDGLDQARTSIEDTKKRAKAAEAAIDSELEPFIQKAYWTEAKEQLRRRVGTLRFDLNTLASAKGDKTAKKAALALSRDFIAKVEALDLAIRKKNKEDALKKLGPVKSSLDSVLASVL